MCASERDASVSVDRTQNVRGIAHHKEYVLHVNILWFPLLVIDVNAVCVIMIWKRTVPQCRRWIERSFACVCCIVDIMLLWGRYYNRNNDITPFPLFVSNPLFTYYKVESQVT